MAGLKQIKSNIAAMRKSQTVTKAMEAVSAAKMRKSQGKALGGRAYARAASSVLARVAGSRELASHPLAARRSIARALYIVVTSDKGLAGALNSAVLRRAQEHIAQSGLSLEQVGIVAIGRKGRDFFSVRGYRVIKEYPNTSELTSEHMRELVDAAVTLFIGHEVDAVRIVYQNFVSTFEQRPTLREVLPLSLEELGKVVNDIAPARGAFALPAQAGELSQPQTYTLEPSESAVLGAVLPMLASVVVYHALLESQASEHSARMVAMKSASDKAGELEHTLTLAYNKARQAAITREVSEIISGTL